MRFTTKEFENFENQLLHLGFSKYAQMYKNSDFQYWKTIENYKIGVSVYDYSKIPHFIEKLSISIQFEILIFDDKFDRLDLSIKDKKMSVNEFISFSEKFIEFYNQLIK